MTPLGLLPPEYIITIDSTLLTAVIVLAVALARTRERIVRLEEWVRLQELLRGETRVPPSGPP